MAASCLGVCLRQVLVRAHIRPLTSLAKNKVQMVNLPKSCWVVPCARSYAEMSQTVEKVDDSHRPLALSPEERLKSLGPELEKKFKVIQLEYQVYEQMGMPIPETMTDAMWLKILECDTKSARGRLYKYFRSLERHDITAQRKKEQRSQLHEEWLKAREGDNAHREPLNTIFLRLRKQTMLKYHNSRLANAMMYGYPLVIDLGYEDYMKQREIINLADQLMQSHGFNKVHREPFHLVFCNVRRGSSTLNALQASSTETPLEKYMITMTEQSYLDLYPRKDLVYLTPNAPNILENYDDNKVYIVGGFVDKSSPQPLSRAKAKEEGIAMAKLPLDYFQKWGQGSKSLTIDQMTRILLDLQMTRDWYKAFKHVPSRKLVNEDPSYGKLY